MECIVLGQTETKRTELQWRLEDLGADWRCMPVGHAEHALALMRSQWTDLMILLPGGQSETLLRLMQDAPLLTPPWLLGMDVETPDGSVPDLPDLPEKIRTWRRTGRLPAGVWQVLPPMQRLARGMLQAVGVPGNMGAWVFLPEMTALTAVHPPLLEDLQHGLYPLIAGRYGLSAGAVERRLRLCVEATWTRGSLTALERFFGSSVDPERGKPTNREFLCRLQEQLTFAGRRMLREA